MLSILIPVYNEEEILERAVNTVHSYMDQRGLEHEIIIVSNGSRDRTEEIGRELERRYQWFKFLALPERGVGKAFVAGVKIASGDIISLDIDLPADLRFIDYANELLKHCQMLVGSKSMGNQKRAITRVLGSQLYIIIAQLFFRLTISDFAPSTKAYRRECLLEVLDKLDPWTGYVFELCVYYRAKGYRVVQIGIDCEDNRKSRFNLLHEGIYRYLHLCKCYRLLRRKDSWFKS